MRAVEDVRQTGATFFTPFRQPSTANIRVRLWGPTGALQINASSSGDVKLLSIPPFHPVVTLDQKRGQHARSNDVTQRSIWRECVLKWFPDLHKKLYFLPPICFNRVQYDVRYMAGVPLQVAQDLEYVVKRRSAPVSPDPANESLLIQDNDVYDDRAREHALHCLRALAEKQHMAMVVISRLHFTKYLDKLKYNVMLTSLPRPADIGIDYRLGCFDLLILHNQYGLILGHIASVGDYFTLLKVPEEEREMITVEKLKEAISHLNKAELVLKYVVSDLPGVRVTKTLILPNISSELLQSSLCKCQHTKQALRRCLETSSTQLAIRCCLLSERMSDVKAPWEVTENTLYCLQKWWGYRVSYMGPQVSMTADLYEELVTRFCGPATTFEIQGQVSGRLEIRSLGQAVSEAGERMASRILCTDQEAILNREEANLVFLTGPPGTGKTATLIYKALSWIRQGHRVHILSILRESYAANYFILNQLQRFCSELSLDVSTIKDRILFRHYNFCIARDRNNAMKTLKAAISNGYLHVIMDGVGPSSSETLAYLYDNLVQIAPFACLWVASVKHSFVSHYLQEVQLTVPLRCPPAVVREIRQSKEIQVTKEVYDYVTTRIIYPTDGPTVRWIFHQNGLFGHTHQWPRDCVKCGHEIGCILTELCINKPESMSEASFAGPPTLEYRDVFVLCDEPLDRNVSRKAIGLIQGLRSQPFRIQVHVLKKDATWAEIRDVVIAKHNMVTVAHWETIQGLARKVVVVMRCTATNDHERLYTMSRCTAQLVIID